MRVCSTCKRQLTDNEPAATCICGEIYCSKCIATFTPEELKAALADAEKHGHRLTFNT